MQRPESREYRVEELAARAAVSVDTIRFYQGQGLLPLPERRGRLAWYGESHLERLAAIRELRAKGLTLSAIRRLVDGELSAADLGLARAVAGEAGGEQLTLADLATRTGVPVELLEALERDGLLPAGPGAGYGPDDVTAAKAALRMVATGIPVTELLGLAARHHAAMAQTAQAAVDLFERHVRAPLRDAGLSDEETSTRLVAAFQELLPAATQLVEHHFRRVLLAAAAARLDVDGGSGRASEEAS